jgi:hypothetical protein
LRLIDRSAVFCYHHFVLPSGSFERGGTTDEPWVGLCGGRSGGARRVRGGERGAEGEREGKRGTFGGKKVLGRVLIYL